MFKADLYHLRLGWTFEPRSKWPRGHHWPFRPARNGHRPPETGGRLRLSQRSTHLVYCATG